MISWPAHWRQLQQQHDAAFHTIFGQHLSPPLWSNLTGLDLVWFDDHIAKSGEAESIAEATERQWGAPARALVERLIGAPS